MTDHYTRLAAAAREACKSLILVIEDSDCPADPDVRREAELRRHLHRVMHTTRQLIKLHGLVGTARRNLRDKVRRGLQRRLDALDN